VASLIFFPHSALVVITDSVIQASIYGSVYQVVRETLIEKTPIERKYGGISGVSKNAKRVI